MSGKLVTGNDGNFMLLLDPLSEDKAVFTSVRCDSDSELTSNAESTDSASLVDLPEPSVIDSCGENGRRIPDTFIPSVHNNTSASFQPVIESVTSLVSPCITSTSMVSSAAAHNIAFSQHSTEQTAVSYGPCTVPPGTNLLPPGTSVIPPGTSIIRPGTSLIAPRTCLFTPSTSSSNIQYIHSNLPPNTCFINNDKQLYYPNSTPLILIPSSKLGQSLVSNSMPTPPVMPVSTTTSSISTPCCMSASIVLQSIVQAGNCAPQVPNPTIPPTVKQNKIQDRNIQVVYPSSIKTSKGIKPNMFILPSTTAQTKLVTTKPAAVSSNCDGETISPQGSRALSTILSPPTVLPLPVKQSVFIPSTISTSSVLSRSVVIPRTGVTTGSNGFPSIVEQVKAGSGNIVKVIHKYAIVTSASDSSLDKNNTSTYTSVTSKAVLTPRSTVPITSSSESSATEQCVLKRIYPNQPVILKLKSGTNVPLPADAIKGIGKSKSSVAQIVIKTPPRTIVADNGKETVGSASTVHVKQWNNTGSVQAISSTSQACKLPLKINNIFSLANQNPVSPDVNTTKSQEKVKSAQVNETSDKSKISCSKKIAESLDPCYVVLEKLSDRQIAHIMSSVADQKRDKCRRRLRSRFRPSDPGAYLERKCSSYCRQRTLKFLCRLGMINCRKVKSAEKTKTIAVTKPNVVNKEGLTSLLNIRPDATRSTSSSVSSVTVQSRPPLVASGQMTGTEVGKLMSLSDIAKGLQTKHVINDSKGLAMQLVVVNNKLYLLPASRGIGTPVATSVLAPPLQSKPSSTVSHVRSRLSTGMTQSTGHGTTYIINAPNRSVIRNVCPPRPTFHQSSTTNSLSTSNREPPSLLSVSTINAVKTSIASNSPRVSQTPIVIRAPLIGKETSSVPDTSKKPETTTTGNTSTQSETTGKKIEPWKLPWNYEIKPEPVTEGYGDEDAAQKSEPVCKTTSSQVITIRLPFQKPASAITSAPRTGLSTIGSAGNASNNAVISSSQTVTQSFIPSKFVKTNQDLIVASSQTERIQRLKEILREKEQMLEDLKRKQASFHT